jgi:hypothetical protein
VRRSGGMVWPVPRWESAATVPERFSRHQAALELRDLSRLLLCYGFGGRRRSALVLIMTGRASLFCCFATRSRDTGVSRRAGPAESGQSWLARPTFLGPQTSGR